MSQAYCATRISPHMAKTAEGFLICLATPIMRSGYYTYKVSELDKSLNDDSEMEVYRPVSEVTDPATIASAEGATVTSNHPASFVTPDTHSWTGMGHAQNARVGSKDKDGNVQLVADLFIKDKSLIDAIERGVRDLSCGFVYNLVQLSNGDWAQTDLRVNHVAVCEEGRAGTSRIMDSVEKDGDMDNAKLDRLCDLLEKLLNQSGAGSEEESEDAECDCGMEGGTHSKKCPCYGKVAEDEDPEAEYERTGGPERKLKGFREVIPTEGSGKGDFVNPVAARDALQSLRQLRPFIEANGDRQARDAYNGALKAIRLQIEAADSYEAIRPPGLRSSRQADASDFETSAAKYHGKSIPVHGELLPADDHRAEDSREREESFDEAVARARQEQIDRWTPKKRR